MSGPGILRPRKRHVGRALRLDFAPLPAGAAASGAPSSAPPVGFRAEESTRGALVSGSIATGLHAAILVAMLMLAWIAPEVTEKIIPVKILNEPVELPGSNEEPAPAPKSLAARAPARAAQMAQMATPQQAPAPAADISTEALQTAQIDAARAPRDLSRRELAARRLDAHQVAAPSNTATLNPATLSPVKVNSGDLRAPKLDFSGPRVVNSGPATTVSAPHAFAGLQNVGQNQHQGSTVTARAPSSGTGPPVVYGVDTGVADGFLVGDGQGTGGTGTSSGTVRCLDSSYTAGYRTLIKQRMEDRWQIPRGTPDNARVLLRFQIDVTGSPTLVEFKEAATPELGQSAVEALRSASPFPAMNDNNRCLSELVLIGTFIANPG